VTTRPDRTEAVQYYFTYIDQVGDGDIRDILERQVDDTIALLRSISDDQSLHRYAPDKWSIREVLGHVNDAERLFAARAFWFARGMETPLPSFEQDAAVATAGSDQRAWNSLIEEHRAVRAASSTLFRYLPEDAWTRQGTASGYPFTVRALAYITAGHVAHHVRLLNERYLGR
jgi:DinB superfamily